MVSHHVNDRTHVANLAKRNSDTIRNKNAYFNDTVIAVWNIAVADISRF